MTKRYEFEVGGGILEIECDEKGEWYDARTVKIPDVEVKDCNGIWDDDAVFRMGDADWDLWMSNETLLSLLVAAKELVKNGKWMDGVKNRKEFEDVFGLNKNEDKSPKSKRVSS